MDGRSSAIPLLRSGVKFTERHRRALLAAGVNAIYIDDTLSEGIEVRQAVDPETRRRATQTVARALDTCKEAMSAGHPLPESVLTGMQKVAEMIARDIEENADMAVALDDFGAAGGLTLPHSIDLGGRREVVRPPPL